MRWGTGKYRRGRGRGRGEPMDNGNGNGGNGRIDLRLASEWGWADGRDPQYLYVHEYGPEFEPSRLTWIFSHFRRAELHLVQCRDEELLRMRSQVKEQATEMENLISLKMENDNHIREIEHRLDEQRKALASGAGQPAVPESPYQGLSPAEVAERRQVNDVRRLRAQNAERRGAFSGMVGALRGDADRWRQVHRKYRNNAMVALEETRPLVTAYYEAFVSVHPRREAVRKGWRPRELSLGPEWNDDDLPQELLSAEGQTVTQAWQHFLSLHQAPEEEPRPEEENEEGEDPS
ncbi:hypothetical protein ACGFI3_18135 [Nonomuraea wenchangensis]|uniref:hypothetical protein n=1 Tax=Nonomuraea wenchangensis TaxID=568860 RepID=UPI003715CCC3